MAVRVDIDGFGRNVDPGSVSTRSSGADVYDDGERPAPWVQRPWSSAREVATSETLELMSIPAEQIAQIRPPVPYVLFPEQELGFVPQPMTIFDVLDTDRWAPQRRSWLSPTIQPPRRSDYQDAVWGGTQRGGSPAVNAGLSA